MVIRRKNWKIDTHVSLIFLWNTRVCRVIDNVLLYTFIMELFFLFYIYHVREKCWLVTAWTTCIRTTGNEHWLSIHKREYRITTAVNLIEQSIAKSKKRTLCYTGKVRMTEKVKCFSSELTIIFGDHVLIQCLTLTYRGNFYNYICFHCSICIYNLAWIRFTLIKKKHWM